MSDRFPRPFTRSGGGRGPRTVVVDPRVPVNPEPEDADTPRNQIPSRSGGYRGTPNYNPRTGRGATDRRSRFSYKLVRCDNQKAQDEIVYLPSDVYRNLPLVQNSVYKIFTGGNSEPYGCFRFVGVATGVYQQTLGAQVDNNPSNCSDCNVDHGRSFNVTDCNDNQLKIADPNDLHGVSFNKDDLIEVTIDGAELSECVIVGDNFDLDAGEDPGKTYTFQRVIGGADENCTACDMIWGYTIEKCDEAGVTYFIEDVEEGFQNGWIGQIHEFKSDVANAENYCAKIIDSHHAWNIDLEADNSFTILPHDSRVKFRGDQCNVCDDIIGFVVNPCDGLMPKFFVEDINGDGGDIVGNTYFWNSTDPNTEPFCATVQQVFAGQEEEITGANWFDDARGTLTRAAQKANCQDCLPVEGCTDPDANNFDPDADVDDGSCIYPPVNPVQLYHWSPDPLGNFSSTSNIQGETPAEIHGAKDEAGAEDDIRWYSDPSSRFAGSMTQQPQEEKLGWYVVRKSTGEDEWEYALATLGAGGSCDAIGLGFALGDVIPAADPPENAEDVDWEIYLGAFPDLITATSELLAVKEEGIDSVRLLPLRENWYSCADGSCASHSAPVLSCLTTGYTNCGTTINTDGSFDFRKSIIVAKGAHNPQAGELVRTGDHVYEVISTDELLEDSTQWNIELPSITDTFINMTAEAALEEIHGEGWMDGKVACGDLAVRFYKVEACGAPGVFGYLQFPIGSNEDNWIQAGLTATPSVDRIIEARTIYTQQQDPPATVCVKVIEEVDSATFMTAHRSRIMVLEATADETGAVWTDCDDCLGIGGGDDGGGGGAPPGEYFEIGPCDGGASIIAKKAEGTAYTVGEVVLYVHAASNVAACGTISAISNATAADYNINASMSDCADCQGYANQYNNP